ncbi:iron chelate uptake ABC transporter family permease subunit [Vibrio sp.]|uniref:ABC transporter permease n=1 Tax=Vibrio viridaestus TaxID=2487322 RepID=A0A3N9TK94_9VIBR|nr:iron chelate uptake ABC transporter family permease subunit [Vibrio viridaestus]MDC0612414.1 iron chelate uptake ABC transporter family permease subunit [Vibrio sp.]RQW64808.1 ABC transporter permease [Vibrio viridaestus]
MKILTFILVTLGLISLFVGVGPMSVFTLYSGDPQAWNLLVASRLPRLISILMAGAGLSIAGLIMQQISQNRFAAPSTSGTIESAMFGYVLSLIFFGSGHSIWLIFVTSITGTLMFVFFIQNIQFKNAIFVPLVGIIFGNIVQSMAFFLAYRFDVVQNLQSWTVANFSTILEGNYELLYIAIPIVIFSYLYATRISAAGMGKDFAVNLGLNYNQVVIIGVVLVSIMTATVVMIVGQLPFLGLIVPNLISFFCGDNLRKNIPITAISGALLVLCCDLVGRLIIFPYEMPISFIINILGGVLFVLFVIKGRLHER